MRGLTWLAWQESDFQCSVIKVVTSCHALWNSGLVSTKIKFLFQQCLISQHHLTMPKA